MLLSLFPFVLLVAGCYALPTGAPAIACEDMFPVGHNASAQTSPPPYMMMVMAMDDHYMGLLFTLHVRGVFHKFVNRCHHFVKIMNHYYYSVTLSGAADTTFRGFYVQARLMGGGTTPQGVMQPDHDDT